MEGAISKLFFLSSVFLLLFLPRILFSDTPSTPTPRDYEADVRKIYKADPDYEKKWPVEFHVRVAEGLLFDLTKAISNLGTPYYDEFVLQDRAILLEGLGDSEAVVKTANRPQPLAISPDLFTDPAELVWGSAGEEKAIAGNIRRHVWTLGQTQQLNADAMRAAWKEYTKGFRFFDRFVIKPKKGSIPSPGTFECLVALEFAGRTKDGSWRRDYGKGMLTFHKTDAGWRIGRFAITEMTTDELSGRMFEDATERWVQNVPNPAHDRLVAYSLDDEINYLGRNLNLNARFTDVHGRVSVVDIDSDGWDDLYVFGQMGDGVLLRNVELPSGERGFVDATEKFGLHLRDLATIAFADLNNDGVQDVIAGRWAAPSDILLGTRGGPTGKDMLFLPAPAEQAGILPSGVSAIAVADVNLDGYLDLYFATTGQYYHLEKLSERDPMFDRIGPRNVFLLNLGRGDFADYTSRFGLEDERPTLAAAFGDYNGDGYPDLALANDFGTTQLYTNENGARFHEVSKESGADQVYFGMGLSWGDYDSDGDLDLYVTAMQSTAGQRVAAGKIPDPDLNRKKELALSPRGNILLKNNGDGTFRDVTEEAAFALLRNANWAYGAQFADFDNDSRLDIFSPNGFYTYPRDKANPNQVVRDY